jgi:GNAT superfamily N-acetyltransferase
VGPVSFDDVRLDDPLVARLLAEWQGEIVARNPAFAPTRGTGVDPDEFVAPHGRFVVVAADGVPVGCGGVRRLAADLGELKRLFVRRGSRRQGVGGILLRCLEARARELGFDELRLDTAGGEPAAPALFRSAGYQPIADYNGSPDARLWFSKRLAS